MTLRYLDYEASRTVANIVVDGSANEATVLTLSHWPGAAPPAGLARDLSAQMAFAYLDHTAGAGEPAAEVVTNNHFDQDGIVSIHALVEPEISLAHRDLLVDVAAAGDFGTYRDRRAARASMALSRLAAAETTCSYSEHTDRLYTELLPRLMSIVLEPERYRELWGDEDAALTAGEHAVATGRVTIAERPELDLAIVTIADDEPARAGHRFGEGTFEGIHPMAIHNATDRFRLLVVHGRRYRYVDRYESWVQYRSRPVAPRVDMRPLAARLTELETGGGAWLAGAPDDLDPQLHHDGESTIAPDALVAIVTAHLAG
ncbi:MAG TPA: DUF6687 family protein [Ilumatobacter sp.]